MLWTYQRMFTGHTPAAVADTVDDARPRELLFLVPLLVAIVVMGGVPGLALDAIDPGPVPRRSVARPPGRSPR
ncbi:MAG: NADH-quinone oxidoreductase subunit [Actinomycetia bacterium]|nr:NADH-quinone oxidoreductase subunit [Actinomycetes bacterium]